jgi:microcystin-dependent protein
MSDPYLGEIRIFAGTYAPNGWALCNGQRLSINQDQALFSLLRSTYGGDDQTYFNLLDLRRRLPLTYGQLTDGSDYQLGQNGGDETINLAEAEMPAHTHPFYVSNNVANTDSPANNMLATVASPLVFWCVPNPPTTTDVKLSSVALTAAGQNAPHNNVMPTQGMNYIISLTGEYPARR